MDIETAVLWIGFFTGILGAIGFFWQLFQYWMVRKEQSNKVLNRDVLRPWSDVQLKERYGPAEVNALRLLIPKDALPGRAASTIPDEGLDVDRLPGIKRGGEFLREHHAATWSLWNDVKALMDLQRSTLEQRTALLKPQVIAMMSAACPGLRPVPWSEYAPDTYIPENVIAETEATGYYSAKNREIPHAVRSSKTQSGDTLYYEFMGNSYPLFRVTDQNLARPDAFNAILAKWIADPEIRRLNEGLVKCHADLGAALERFRSALKEVTVAIDIKGG